MLLKATELPWKDSPLLVVVASALKLNAYHLYQ